MTDEEFYELEEAVLSVLQGKASLVGSFIGQWTINGQPANGLTLSGHKWSIYGLCVCGATLDSIKRVFTGNPICPGPQLALPGGVNIPLNVPPAANSPWPDYGTVDLGKLIEICGMCDRELCPAIDEYFGKCPNCRNLCKGCRTRCVEPGFCR